MNDMQEDNDQFKLSMDDNEEEAAIPAAVDDLRIEKLSTRVTLISIMIPVLIVIIVVITYLDIKKRVLRTEDTGTIEVQKLSKDLDSRYSSLSLGQARLEESFKRFSDQNNQSLAAIQVKLKKTEDHLDQLKGGIEQLKHGVVHPKELRNVTEEVRKQVNTMGETLDEVTGQIVTLSEKLQNQMSQLEAGFADSKAQIDGLEQKLVEVDQNKMDKPTMDLAIRLATLRIEQDLKAQLDSVEGKLLKLEKQMSQHPAPASSASPAPPAAAKPRSSSSKPQGQKSSTGHRNKIEEQPIPR